MGKRSADAEKAKRVLAQPDVPRLAHALEMRAAREIAASKDARRAAVAVLLRPAGVSTALEMLMIRRARWEGDPWSGHIALPGGRQEAGEALVETVVRETREETAIDLVSVGRILGRLDDLQARTVALPRIVITPFVAVMVGEATIVPSAEVAEAFWVPVAALRDPAATRDTVIELPRGPLRVPSFQYEGNVIWGLTERILRQFLGLVDEA